MRISSNAIVCICERLLRRLGTLWLLQVSSALYSQIDLFREVPMATWIKCTDTKHETVYVNLDNAATVTRNDGAEKVTERGTVIS
jgi:hypothetical protein